MIVVCLLIIWQWNTVLAQSQSWEPRIALPGQCGKNEYYNDCGPPCSETCFTLFFHMRCHATRCVAGCFCKRGFLRIGQGAACTKDSSCRPMMGSRSQGKEILVIRGVPLDRRLQLDSPFPLVS